MKIAIWGLGFVGVRCYSRFQELGWQVDAYSRATQANQSVIFDALSSQTWQIDLQREQYDISIVTFSLEQCPQEFFELLFYSSQNCFLLGTTGIYQRIAGAEKITEDTPVDCEHPRYKSEQTFLELGGKIIRLAGIYGDTRNPLNWLKSPRVGYSNNQLNLIYVHDIVDALGLCCKNIPQNSIYNLCDGVKHTWKDIIDFVLENHLVAKEEIKTVADRLTPLVTNTKFCREYDMPFHDLYEYLRQTR